MIDYDTYRRIHHLHESAGLTVAQIARELSLDPRTVPQWLDEGQYGSVNVGNTRRRLSFFVMVLCYSRLMYVEFTVSETLEHFLACHVNAFEFFGMRCPARIMVDNLKSAVYHLAGRVEAAQQISLEAGGNFITIGPNGIH